MRSILAITAAVLCTALIGCTSPSPAPTPVVVAPSVLDDVLVDVGARTGAPITKMASLIPASADAIGVVDLASLSKDAGQMLGSKKALKALQKDLKAVFARLIGPDLTGAKETVAWMSNRTGAIGLVLSGRFGRSRIQSKQVKTVAGLDAVQVEGPMYLAALGSHVVIGNEAALHAMSEVHQGKQEALTATEEWKQVEAGLKLVRGKKPLLVLSGRGWIMKPLLAGTPFAKLEIARVSASLGRDFSLRAAVEAGTTARLMLSGAIEQFREQARTEAEGLRSAGLSNTKLIESLGQVMGAHSLSASLDLLTLDTQGDSLVATVKSPGDSANWLVFSSVASAVAIPAFVKYTRRAKTTEAIDNLDRIYHGAAVYYTTPMVNARGERLPCQFPASVATTPTAGNCCSSGGRGGADADGDDRCDPNPKHWAGDTWSALNFAPEEPHRFVYRFESSGVGPDASFTVTAYGDLDCDGVMSTFQRMGFGDPDSSVGGECSLAGTPSFYVEKETE